MSKAEGDNMGGDTSGRANQRKGPA
uniref:Uncharacterized protein n=1 Tax=Anguilla anguilla TaxID=7936 RepID=A0A0E9PIS9_ANGAN